MAAAAFALFVLALCIRAAPGRPWDTLSDDHPRVWVPNLLLAASLVLLLCSLTVALWEHLP